MTAERLATFTPVAGVDRRYRVNLLEDRWDETTRTSRVVTAIGPGGAKQAALDLLLHDPHYPCPEATVTGVYLLCDGCSHESHSGACSHRWMNEREVQECPCEVAA